jgi:preprotein translocase subunit SecA
LEYDDILNHHRIAIYSKRNRILDQDEIHDEVLQIITEQVNAFIETTIEEDKIEKIEDTDLVIEKINSFAEQDLFNEESFNKIYSKSELKEILEEKIIEKIDSIKNSVVEAEFYDYEKRLYLQSVDELWMRHIDDMSHLREEVAFE